MNCIYFLYSHELLGLKWVKYIIISFEWYEHFQEFKVSKSKSFKIIDTIVRFFNFSSLNPSLKYKQKTIIYIYIYVYNLCSLLASCNEWAMNISQTFGLQKPNIN